jgi:hypothetical protein
VLAQIKALGWNCSNSGACRRRVSFPVKQGKHSRLSRCVTALRLTMRTVPRQTGKSGTFVGCAAAPAVLVAGRPVVGVVG